MENEEKFIKNKFTMCERQYNRKYKIPSKSDTEALKRGTRIHEILENLYKIDGFFTLQGEGGARKFDFTKIDREILIELEELGFEIKDLMFSLDKDYLNSTYGCFGTRRLSNPISPSNVDGIDEHGAYNIKPNGEKEYLK